MTMTHTSTILIIGLSVLTIVSGDKNKEVSFSLDSARENFSFPAENWNKVMQTRGVGKSNTRTYELGEESEWRVLGTNTNDKRASAGLSGSVTCTCNKESGGCSPDQKGNCYMTSCSNCSKSTSGVMIKNMKNKEVEFHSSKESLEQNLPDTNKELFNLIQVKEALRIFKRAYSKYLVFDDEYCPESKVSGVCKAKKGDVFVGVDVFGSTTYVPANKAIFKDSRFQASRARAGLVSVSSLSCSCADGSCPMDSTWGHKYCDASNCQSCTMSGMANVQKFEHDKFLN